MEQSSAIVVPDKRQFPVRSQKRFKETGQAVEDGPFLRGSPRQACVKQEHIERINMVVRRLFEMAAVSAHLAYAPNGSARWLLPGSNEHPSVLRDSCFARLGRNVCLGQERAAIGSATSHLSI